MGMFAHALNITRMPKIYTYTQQLAQQMKLVAIRAKANIGLFDEACHKKGEIGGQIN